MTTPFRSLAPVVALCLLLAGCAAQKLPIVFWPVPPEEPRIQWLGTFASQDDFPKSGFQVFLEGLTGTPELASFKYPYGIASDSKGLIYIADSVDRNLRVYDLEKHTVEYYSKEPYFGRPNGIAIDSADNLYVVDGELKGVLVFGPDRVPLRRIGSREDLKSPAFVEVDEGRDRVYVSDGQANKIVVYNRAGAKLFEIGPKLSEERWLFNPQGMAIDREGNLFVAEMLNAQIVALTPEGKLLRTFGERGDAAYQFEAPKDVAFDSDGNLWVADNRRSQIYTYTPDGRLLLATGSAARTEDSPLGFSTPTAIAIDAQDRIYITDRMNRRFSAWRYLSTAYRAAHPLSAEEQAALDAAADAAKKLRSKEGASAQP